MWMAGPKKAQIVNEGAGRGHRFENRQGMRRGPHFKDSRDDSSLHTSVVGGWAQERGTEKRPSESISILG
jgi:hypothetical protein